jgi:hypothetical protein
MTADHFNSKAQNAFKWALVFLLEKQGFFPEIFFNPKTARWDCCDYALDT